MNAVMVRMMSQAHRLDHPGMDSAEELVHGVLHDEPVTHYLGPPGGRSGAPSHEHQNEQDRAALIAPEVEVVGGETGCRNDGEHLEQRVPYQIKE